MTERIKLLLADVDGTLVTKEKILTERAIAAVQALRARGIGFALTSGRPPRGMDMLLAPLGIDTPIAAFNGGLFVDADMRTLEAHTLAPEIARRALDMILAAGLDAWVYRGEEWLLRDAAAPHVAREEWTVKFPPRTVPDIHGVLDGAVKIVGCSDDAARMGKTETAVQKALGEAASAARSQPYYLDVTHARANKGGVVDWLAARLEIPAASIATIGDQPNDVLMFRRGGLSIAMGQSSDQVKAAATETTASSEEEGFALAVERFILDRAHG